MRQNRFFEAPIWKGKYHTKRLLQGNLPNTPTNQQKDLPPDKNLYCAWPLGIFFLEIRFGEYSIFNDQLLFNYS